MLFGGGGLAPLADTWEWNGSTWTQSLAVGPTPRSVAAFGYDLARQRIVLFGGLSSAGSLLADTWEFDGASWTQFVVPGPSARYSSAIAYDPIGNRMLMFGGNTSVRTLILSADTWVWNGTAWQLLLLTNAPPPRMGFGFATDIYRQLIVLHGGRNGGGFLQSDTWTWDGSGWHQIVTATDPGPRAEFGFVFDGSRGVMVRFGGSAPVVGDTRDTWLLDRDTWIRDVATIGPSSRHGCPLAYDAGRSKVVMFGGYGNSGFSRETWEYAVPPVARWTPYGVGCAGTAGVPLLATLPAARPVVGGTLGLELTGVLDGPVLFATGFSTTTWLGVSLPAPLDAIGLPGCALYGSVDQLDFGIATLGRATLSLPVPNVPSLAGITFVNQALASDPGVNAFGAVVSNAGIGVIGVL